MSLDRDTFRERLGTYLLGVAIGCTLLGIAFYAYSRRQPQAPPPPPPGVPAR